MFRHWFILRRLRRQASPRSDERRAIDAYLQKVGALNVHATSSSAFAFVRVFTGVAVMVLIVCIGLSSYAYASDAVLPDTVLYPVRQAIERVEVKLAVTPVQKKNVTEKLVERRKKEVKILVEKNRPVPKVLKNYLKEVAKREVEKQESATSTERMMQDRPRTPAPTVIREQLQRLKRQQKQREDRSGREKIQERSSVSSKVPSIFLATTTRRYARPSVKRQEERQQQERKQDNQLKRQEEKDQKRETQDQNGRRRRQRR